MLEAMARIAPSQPNEAMARIASRRNRTISLDPNLSALNFRVGFQFSCRGGLGEKRVKMPLVTTTQIAKFDVQPSRNFAYPPVVRRLLQ
jgi:hypothetical protein